MSSAVLSETFAHWSCRCMVCNTGSMPQDLKQSVEVDMDAYRRERSMQEWEHFQGSTEEVKVCTPQSPDGADTDQQLAGVGALACWRAAALSHAVHVGLAPHVS